MTASWQAAQPLGTKEERSTSTTTLIAKLLGKYGVLRSLARVRVACARAQHGPQPSDEEEEACARGVALGYHLGPAANPIDH